MKDNLLMSHADFEDHRDEAFAVLARHCVSRDVRHSMASFDNAVNRLAAELDIHKQDATDYVFVWLDDVGWED